MIALQSLDLISSRHTFRRGKQIEADGTPAGRNETCSVWRQQTSTTPIRRVATEGMADQAAPVYKSTTPTKRVATEGMADQAAPVLKSTWPTRPVATAGDATRPPRCFTPTRRTP